MVDECAVPREPAEAEVSLDQRGHDPDRFGSVDRAAVHDVERNCMLADRPRADLLGREMAAMQVGQRMRDGGGICARKTGATKQEPRFPLEDKGSNSGPHQGRSCPAAMRAVDAGSPDLQASLRRSRERRKVELAGRIESGPRHRGGPREKPVGADDLRPVRRLPVLENQVLAMDVEAVRLDALGSSRLLRAHLRVEYAVAKPKRRPPHPRRSRRGARHSARLQSASP